MRTSRNNSACCVAYLGCVGAWCRMWAWYGIRGGVVGVGCVKQAAGGLAVAERIACDVVLLQKTSASDRQCGRSRCTSYTTLRRGRKDRRAPRKGAHGQKGWGRRQYIYKQEIGEYGVRGDEEREKDEKEIRWRRNAPIIRSQASNSQVLRCGRRVRSD
jgi:hypothetical protein